MGRLSTRTRLNFLSSIQLKQHKHTGMNYLHSTIRGGKNFYNQFLQEVQNPKIWTYDGASKSFWTES
jgi:hypothetical protein